MGDIFKATIGEQIVALKVIRTRHGVSEKVSARGVVDGISGS